MKSDKIIIINLLESAIGQIDLLSKMIEDDRYYIDIFKQILAIKEILSKVNKDIIHDHIIYCFGKAFTTDEQLIQGEEFMIIIDKLLK